jgi:hypothetical protein
MGESNSDFYNVGGGAFYLPCCGETLAVTAARDHCCEVLPHHIKGRTPRPEPQLGGGTFSTADRSCAFKGCGSRLLTFKACPTLGNRDPHLHIWISGISVWLFEAGNLAQSILRRSRRDLAFLL